MPELAVQMVDAVPQEGHAITKMDEEKNERGDIIEKLRKKREEAAELYQSRLRTRPNDTTSASTEEEEDPVEPLTVNHAEEQTPRRSDEQEDPYLHVLQETMAGSGRWAFGVAGIEIWIETSDEKRGMVLERAKGGWWRDPIFEESEALTRLEDSLSPDYVPPNALIPGLGVAGTLWSEVPRGNHLNLNLNLNLNQYSNHNNHHRNTSVWRDLSQLAQDPDQPQDNGRLALMAEVFGIATGVPFSSRITGLRGIVVYYARRSASAQKLSDPINQRYLQCSADLLGSVVSWDQPRLDVIQKRNDDFAMIKSRVYKKIIALSRFGMLRTIMENTKDPNKDDASHYSDVLSQTSQGRGPLRPSRLQLARSKSGIIAKKAKNKASLTVKKMKGGGQIPPPPLSNSQCLFALAGCFLSLLSLSALNEKLETSFDRGIILAPLGALVTMHYGLTSAPASQPRNSVLGVLVATVCSKSVAYIPTSILAIWVRVALGPAIAIAVTLKLGLAHPPAGAVAVLFAIDTKNDWKSLGLLLFGYIEAIMFAVIFVNLNGTKTFPMYWGIPNTQEWWGILKHRLKETSGQYHARFTNLIETEHHHDDTNDNERKEKKEKAKKISLFFLAQKRKESVESNIASQAETKSLNSRSDNPWNDHGPSDFEIEP